jgi:hypothetical protein
MCGPVGSQHANPRRNQIIFQRKTIGIGQQLDTNWKALAKLDHYTNCPPRPFLGLLSDVVPSLAHPWPCLILEVPLHSYDRPIQLLVNFAPPVHSCRHAHSITYATPSIIVPPPSCQPSHCRVATCFRPPPLQANLLRPPPHLPQNIRPDLEFDRNWGKHT